MAENEVNKGCLPIAIARFLRALGVGQNAGTTMKATIISFRDDSRSPPDYEPELPEGTRPYNAEERESVKCFGCGGDMFWNGKKYVCRQYCGG